jgi:hypothetical protein
VAAKVVTVGGSVVLAPPTVIPSPRGKSARFDLTVRVARFNGFVGLSSPLMIW